MSEDNDDVLIASMDENQDELVIHIGKIRKFYNDYKKLETEVKDLQDRINKAYDELSEGVKFCKNDSQGLYEKCNIAIRREKRVMGILKGE